MASGFVTETEIENRRIARQEEWEKVRKPEDPEEAPEEPQDHRSLFERLEEQRVKKQEEYDEAHQFKNQFRGLDDDEVDFLDKIDDIRTEAERQRIIEERKEVLEYQKKQELLKQQELEERLRIEIKGPELKRSISTGGAKTGVAAKSKQQLLLAAAVKRKSGSDTSKGAQENDAKKYKASENVDNKTLVEKEDDKNNTKVPSLMGLIADYTDSESENES